MSITSNLLRANRKCLSAFCTNLVWKGNKTFSKFNKHKKNGSSFPAFQFISLTNKCNLECQGCWVYQDGDAKHIELGVVQKIISESNAAGSWFFGLLGGEPLLYPHLIDVLRQNKRSYFQLFTNGILLNDSTADDLRKCANVTPLISFEGDETIADIRRGGRGVYRRTIDAIKTSVAHGLITGVAVSVCKSNIDMALSPAFVSMLHDLGVVYLWYYIYRPSGKQPCYELALSAGEIEKLRRFLVEGRTHYPMVLIDSYWDADGNPFCPAAEGLSHHINPYGQIEPCPVIQYSCGNAGGQDLKLSYEQSGFLRDLKEGIKKQTRGCILMENPGWLAGLAGEHKVPNSSGRPGMEEDLRRGHCVCSHGSCPVIPETSFFYRFAKRRAFFGLGAYG